MIIKKPYAFLIKHFKLIHIILLVMGAFVLLKNSSTISFIKDFAIYGVYDSMNDPITAHIPGYLFIILLFMSILNIIAVFLLRHKDKPWKLYLVPTVTYLGLMIMYALLLLYFTGYNGIFERTQIGLYRDVMNILTLAQMPALIVYLIRCLGLDLNKFNFQNDQEFLELDEKDQMELEINFNIDKHSFKRIYRRVKRNAGYFIEGHKKLVIACATILVLVIGYNIYKYQFVANKAYSQNDVYQTGAYTMKINNIYYTNKDQAGNIISNSSSFVIMELTIRNNYYEKLSVRTDRFHLYNGIEQYTDSSNQFADKFTDFGETYSQGTSLESKATMNIILIYKVDKKLAKDRFVLYYQEKDGEPVLRKIKIKVKDVSTIKDNGNYKLGQEMKFPLPGGKDYENLAPDGFSIKDKVNYIIESCEDKECRQETQKLLPSKGKKIAVISYMTEEFESKDIIDFSSKYGKINYIDSNNKKQSIPMEKAPKFTYLGQYAYVEVPEEIENSNTIDLEYTIRNNRYTYRVRNRGDNNG